MNVRKLLGLASAIALASSARAADTIPDVTSMTASITAIGTIAAAAATLGFSIWLYRKVKSKAGQALG